MLSSTQLLRERIYMALNRGREAEHQIKRAWRPEIASAFAEVGIFKDTLHQFTPHMIDGLSDKALYTLQGVAHVPLAVANALRDPKTLNTLGLERFFEEFKSHFLGDKPLSECVPTSKDITEHCADVIAQYDKDAQAAGALLAKWRATYKELHTKNIAIQEATGDFLHGGGAYNKLLHEANAVYQESGFKSEWASRIIEAAGKMTQDGGNQEEVIAEIIELALPLELHAERDAYIANLQEGQAVKAELKQARNAVVEELRAVNSGHPQAVPFQDHPDHGPMRLDDYVRRMEEDIERELSTERHVAAQAAKAAGGFVEETRTAGAAAGGKVRVGGKVAEKLEQAGAKVEAMASTMGGRGKWILGGIAVTTVALGAVLFYAARKRSHVEEERARRTRRDIQNNVVQSVPR